MSQKTSKDYCEWLRELGRRLASGEIAEHKMSVLDLAGMLNGDDYYKVTKNQAYSRTIINRVPEVKAVGKVRIRTEETEDDKFYVFSLNRDVKRKVITSEDLPAVQAKAVEKFAARILASMPNVTDMQGDKLAGACEGISRYQEMIRNLVNEEK